MNFVDLWGLCAEIRELKAINKGLEAEYKDNQKQIELLNDSIENDKEIVFKWRKQNEKNK